ncbi:uncharacterized protein BYT42DRAFT_244302 [Radiomyces spectabilis]|uniref:uncharacterized protein n=1 Tax=Radiomyces spectabilis TaxID=64574 RepID=UPI00222059BD|nr:uncharacterized protein BYT42DRAFT_244302 [Radiomyces spectabilis]KAI8388710.1 hypothetical protein BYT42DRAFT_244302 [Radiomyces spectabilis]
MPTFERKPGQAPIKDEFRKEKWFEDDQSGEAAAVTEVFGDEAQEGKKFNDKDKKGKRVRGANKGQRGKKRIEDNLRICQYTAREEACPFGESCRFSHDLEAYMASKPEDLGDRCVQFDLFGKCRHGFKCRFLKAHLDENGKLIVNEELVKKNPVYTTNGISSETQQALQNFQFKFPKSEVYMKEVEAEKQAEEDMKAENRKRKLDALEAEEEKGPENSQDASAKKEKTEHIVTTETTETTKVTDNDQTVVSKQVVTETVVEAPAKEATTVNEEKPELPIDHDLPDVNMNVEPKEKSVGPIDTGYKKIIDFRNKTYLAPLTTVGNLPFRRICKEFGVDITCGEMAMCQNLLKGQQSEWALTKRHASEDIFGIQICASKVEHAVKACEIINQEVDVDFVDLNMGCPIDLVFNQGGGSALMDARGRMSKILRGMKRVLDVPVTAKFRTGIKQDQPTAHKLIGKLEDWGMALGTIHGRSRMQRYTKLANWDYIGELKKLTNNMPLCGNGDVLSFEDYNKHKKETGVDTVMIGRGALIKPWIFDEIKNQRHWDISSRERFDMLKRFCDYGLEHWGTDSQGINATRRFLCEWQSFLYRYIPAGLLEVVPQHINERAPPYFGRDDLETLMASPRASDWVKLSELLLGPAPEDFQFIPKHKSNSFEVSLSTNEHIHFFFFNRELY